ncbi:MAG: aldo/keto reductase [Peptoniphilaceae bacterium]
MPITLLLVSCASFLNEMKDKKNRLGNTGITVSGLCFGTLTMTPMQKNLTVKEGAALLVCAYEEGITFADTAQYYENYAYLKEALRTIPRDRYVIATKSYAWDKETARQALDEALFALDTDYIDIFLLHEQESEHTLRGHAEALAYFCTMRKKGYIRATGLSTHRLAGVKAALSHEDIQIIHPIVNKEGIGIPEGTMAEMETLLLQAKAQQKGIYAMKPLGGGHLIADYNESMRFALSRPYVDAVAVGMQSEDEVRCNAALARGERNLQLEEKLKKKTRKLHVAEYCIGCGACEKRCRQGGIRVINGRAVPNDHCILCGYCAKACPEFCIKVI